MTVENENRQYAVRMENISKFFGSFRALNAVGFKVRRGSVHALLGENGAGKSTLMNILYGFYCADEGEIYLNGSPADIKNPRVAIEHGIGMVHQHFMLVENFTVAQNIMLGCETVKSLGVLDMEAVRKKISALGEKYGLPVDPDAKIEDLSVASQQRVEILKALYRGVDILILDEPTAVLTPQEIDELIRAMHRLTGDGKTVIIITHKLSEIKKSSEYCTVIRRGKYVGTVRVSEVDENMMASMMVGRAVSLHVKKTPASPGGTVLEIKNLSVRGGNGLPKVRDLSMRVRAGEIVGLIGVDGNGQTELTEALTGLRKCDGVIAVKGREIQNKSPRGVRGVGVGAIHEDRQKRGLIMDFSVAENLALEAYRQPAFSKRGVLDLRKIRQSAERLINKFDVRPDDCAEKPAGTLSGGNQQKVVIAREVENDPDLLIAAQPTRGLDAGAIEFVHKSLLEQRDKGKAILLISMELDEIMDLSDRINVIYAGKIVGELTPEKTDENEVLSLIHI